MASLLVVPCRAPALAGRQTRQSPSANLVLASTAQPGSHTAYSTRPDTRRRPSTPSGGQGFQTATRRTSPGAPGAKPAGQQPRLRVVLSVPEFRVIFGEEVVVVGSCEELGDWNVATAPRLQWQEGNTWVGQVHLPPGTHTFKLVVVRQDGFASWEEGPDRELEVPEGAAAVAAAARTGLHVKCGYGDWQPVDVSLATAAQLDALLLPTPTMPAGAQPPAPADSYMAGDEVLGAPTQNGNAKAAAMSAARLAAARILEPSSTLSPATA